MGVPAFFRWLSSRYPSVITYAKEPDGDDDTTPNANYQEFDNLYLDMNGIIHPCTHPEDASPPKDEEEAFKLICQYIDRLFSIIRPRRLLYMAIDGVAPRAKMNQQRSRRFRSALEAQEKWDQIAEIRKKLEEEGLPVPPERSREDEFDSNCITPGTPFMDRLSLALKEYIAKRRETSQAWRDIKIILSSSNVPGEGEHKIMEYIRLLRASPDHDPKLAHCLCGADADLIMLGLATHEENFTILREEWTFNNNKACEVCGLYGHEIRNCKGLMSVRETPLPSKSKNFLLLRLDILRDCLSKELTLEPPYFPFELKRAIDDWVFLCFFVGNDFLPHLPSLEIREGAVDRLVNIYKRKIVQLDGWLTDNGVIFADRVKIILQELGRKEDEIFKNRHKEDVQQRERYRQKEEQRKNGNERRTTITPTRQPPNAVPAFDPKQPPPGFVPRNPLSTVVPAPFNRHVPPPPFVIPQPGGRRESIYAESVKSQSSISWSVESWASEEQKKSDGEDKIREMLGLGKKKSRDVAGPPPKLFKGVRQCTFNTRAGIGYQVNVASSTPSTSTSKGGGIGETPPTPLTATGTPNGEKEDPYADDKVRLWEAGWKERYYDTKFGVNGADVVAFGGKVALAYMEGLCWVLQYYYRGCASWTWFYPYYYAPFASDFGSIGGYQPDFSVTTTPFKPLEQLMAVFPSYSCQHIPESWRHLMTSEHSPIIDFYPTEFKTDLNGKRYAWQGVSLLPFVDEKRLLGALDGVYPLLSSDEHHLNRLEQDNIFEPIKRQEEETEPATKEQPTKVEPTNAVEGKPAKVEEQRPVGRCP